MQNYKYDTTVTSKQENGMNWLIEEIKIPRIWVLLASISWLVFGVYFIMFH